MSALLQESEARMLLDAAIRGELPDERGRFGDWKAAFLRRYGSSGSAPPGGGRPAAGGPSGGKAQKGARGGSRGGGGGGRRGATSAPRRGRGKRT